MAKIIGRERELQELEKAYKAEESLFVVVYGRRRVGKTFLVREAFADKLAFYATGVNQENKEMQLMYFYHALCKYSDKPLHCPRIGWRPSMHSSTFWKPHKRKRKWCFWTSCHG